VFTGTGTAVCAKQDKDVGRFSRGVPGMIALVFGPLSRRPVEHVVMRFARLFDLPIESTGGICGHQNRAD
jgi:hypothetical protein